MAPETKNNQKQISAEIKTIREIKIRKIRFEMWQ
jgi:hypothetical protein